MKKQNLSLIFGISIPILMIVFVALSIYIPRLFAEPPQYDFLYYVTDTHFASEHPESYYTVRQGYIDFIDNNPDENFEKRSRIFRHDVSENESFEMSYEDARYLELDASYESPDGYELVNSYGGDILYIDISYDELFLKGHNVSTEMNLFNTNIYYNQFNFLGWIHE